MIKELKKTCDACPSQWEGKLDDGRPFYARYRWGYLSFRVADIGKDPVNQGEEIVGVAVGDEYDGTMPTAAMIEIVRKEMACHKGSA